MLGLILKKNVGIDTCWPLEYGHGWMLASEKRCFFALGRTGPFDLEVMLHPAWKMASNFLGGIIKTHQSSQQSSKIKVFAGGIIKDHQSIIHTLPAFYQQLAVVSMAFPFLSIHCSRAIRSAWGRWHWTTQNFWLLWMANPSRFFFGAMICYDLWCTVWICLDRIVQ